MHDSAAGGGRRTCRQVGTLSSAGAQAVLEGCSNSLLGDLERVSGGKACMTQKQAEDRVPEDEQVR